jgi:putative addiction module component (TIGR02574 family)
MTKLAEIEALVRKLPATDRLRLMESTWDSIDDKDNLVEMPEWHKAELDTRLAEFERNPEAGKPWRESLAEIRDELNNDSVL